jgi:hypothetical protein
MSSTAKIMTPKTKPSPAKNQSQRFVEKAREIGCDEDEAAFDRRLRKIAKATPPKDPQPARKRAKGR